MSEFGKYQELILDLLERNSNEIKDFKKDISKQLNDLQKDVTELNQSRHVIKEHKDWKKEVTDVWSPKNMETAHKEIYIQKSAWSKTIGILIGVELVVGIIIFFLKK
jgi:hypothetical protein